MNQKPIEYHPADRPRPVSRRGMLRAVLAGIGASAGYVFWREWNTQTPAPVARGPQTRPEAPVAQATRPVEPVEPESVRVERVYHQSIVPALAAFDLRNGAAVGRAVGMLHERIQARRGRIPKFTRDVSSWGTRFGILKRYPGDLWRKLRGGDASAVSSYVNQKFRDDILSEIGLRQDVVAVVARFNEDMAASRNVLYSELELPLRQIKVIRPADDVSLDRITKEVRDQARALSGGLASQSVAAGLVEFSGGWLAMDAGQAVASRIVGQIIARVGAAMATDAIAAGGATVEASAAGGGAGSLGGPLGTVIGIGVGLIVGVIIDWRLSKVFEAKIAEQCSRFLDTLEYHLRDGSTPGSGLRGALLESTRLTNEAQTQAVKIALRQTDSATKL
jgi:hypothetical protein